MGTEFGEDCDVKYLQAVRAFIAGVWGMVQDFNLTSSQSEAFYSNSVSP